MNKWLQSGLLFLVLIHICQDVLSQTSVEHSLNQKAQLAKTLIFTNPARASIIADSIINLSQKNKLLVLEATGWNIKGVIHAFTASPDSAYKYFLNSERLGIKAKDKLSIAKARQNQNIPLQQMGKYDLAVKQCLEALKIYAELNDLRGQTTALGDIGNILINQKQFQDAINYLEQAIEISKKLKEESIRPNLYNSLGVALISIDKPKAALSIYKEALLLADRNNNIKNQISININIGEVLWTLEGKADQTLQYYSKAEALAKKYGDKLKLSLIYQNMGLVYSSLGKNDDAHYYTLLARDLAIETRQVYPLEKIYNSLASYYERNNELQKAYIALKAKDSLTRVILNETNNKNLNEIRTRYETEKKDLKISLLNNQNKLQQLQLIQNDLILSNTQLELKTNKLLISNQKLNLKQQQDQITNQELEATNKEQKIKILNTQNTIQRLELMKRNIIIAIIIGVLILIIIIAFLVYNRYKIRNQNKLQTEMLKQQEKAAQAVINAEESERQRIAAELHDGLGQLFSAVKLNLSGIRDHIEFKDEHSKNMFTKTINMVDESCREVRVISHQMAPNVLLKSGLTAAIRDFINKIDARKLKINLETFGLQEKLDQNVEAVLYRIIQESVNNVIKHAEASSLDIQLSRDEDGINVMIEDNGKGFSQAHSETAHGMGLKNIISRVNYLKGTVEISSEPGKGTLVAIHIPNKTKS